MGLGDPLGIGLKRPIGDRAELTMPAKYSLHQFLWATRSSGCEINMCYSVTVAVGSSVSQGGGSTQVKASCFN